MEPSLASLETKRNELYQQLPSLGDFRPGIVSVNFRKCGKKPCTCTQKDNHGHGPQYLWNTTLKGKSLAQNLHPGPELNKAKREVDAYKQFEKWHQEVVALNMEICRLRPVDTQSEQHDDDAGKKKLRRKSAVRRIGK